jgi:oligopeptidase A
LIYSFYHKIVPYSLILCLPDFLPAFFTAEVMSADCFAAFEEVGLDNEEAVRATGKRFRETVLAMGGGKHPSDVYKAFRGRDPDPAALLRHTGLTK